MKTNQVDAAKDLLPRGASPNSLVASAHDGSTALVIAAGQGYRGIEVVAPKRHVGFLQQITPGVLPAERIVRLASRRIGQRS